MSQPVSSTQLVNNAVEILIKRGIQTVHPNFNSKCVLRADVGHVTVSFPVAEISGGVGETSSTLLDDLKRYGRTVAYASWKLNQPIDSSVSHETFDPKIVPKPHETVNIRGEVDASMDQHPKMMYVITVSRDDPSKERRVHAVVAKGCVILQANPSPFPSTQPTQKSPNPPHALSTSSATPAPPPAAIPPALAKLSRLSPNRTQQFMYVNARAKGTTNHKQLERILEGWSISPVSVTCCELFLGSSPNKVFYFDVSTAMEEAKIRENMKKEKEWTRTFCFENFAKNKSFFTETIQTGELFQTVLVATSINKPNVLNWNRKKTVWSETVLRKALNDPKVFEMEKELNGEGKKLMASLKKLLGKV
ncbi:hypothetical protein B9Z55_004103 [Caenorhabditis nigoni]|uniref:Uncharacterized protein n=1 Tax=Caenorhabditis nigoni TaxID=1611254 RepID=A0A2G5UUW6_9PELO|nr:hypothetical protein B9Z55_004103 [Caenorhabditis nigoni]